ncbi:leucyl aminopeptidase [Pseudonocardia asaccharolytica]|uniref:Probable cytosol aminopeptidase n=1 Tax=Pseudonocardia asaccharolytica DSM 44247 = NBRC 16224 TaxID=1123024 RepID=A0A511D111_9PSEU|nr:leucyl aminopeptidase [Pseudonocardia asaccharolytica]GEL18466.1 putative cytosol aminopeptidase [Pseudonocardia asaccharolytica DSM 44247 = NBRC 16224]
MSTELRIRNESAATAEADAIVVGLLPAPEGSENPVLAAGAEEVDAAFDGGLATELALLGATGKAEEVVKLASRGVVAATVVVAVGLGKPNDDGAIEPEQVRRASGAAARALAGTGYAASTLSRIDLPAAAEGTLLGAYDFAAYKGNGNGKKPVARVDLLSGGAGTDDAAAHEEQLRRASAVAGAVCTARDLVNTPPNDLYPASFADRARALGEAVGLQVEVLDDAALAEAGYGGLLGVGKGSSRKPRLVRLSWSGGDSPRAKVALVGKGVTFDTGGISIKPAANMDQMTSDMSGAAAVVATTVLAAQLGLPVAVTATVPMAENMPSDTAYRPGDVLRMYGGKTVEVLNTDAEGRLILADAIVRAVQDSPDYLVETSTLTGAQLVALGTRTAGIMGSDGFRDRVAGHAQATGEGGWPMPLPDHLRPELDSRIADIANVTGNRFGGMLVAGVFLSEFVGEGLEWAHIDIAGPAFNTGSPWGYTGKGGTGVPVRTLFAVLSDIAENG